MLDQVFAQKISTSPIDLVGFFYSTIHITLEISYYNEFKYIFLWLLCIYLVIVSSYSTCKIINLYFSWQNSHHYFKMQQNKKKHLFFELIVFYWVIHHSVLMPSNVIEHVSCFNILDFVNHSPINIGMHIVFQISAFVFLHKYLRVEMIVVLVKFFFLESVYVLVLV